MRTLLDVKQEKAAIVSELEDRNNGLTKRQEATRRNRLEFLNHIILYLESSPDEIFIGREIGRIENRIKLIYDQFPGWAEADKDRRKEYEKINDIPKLKKQLKVLRYLKK